MTFALAALLLARSPKPLAEILFDLRGNQIWLRAELDEKPIRALLDTGSGSSVLDEKAAIAAGIVKRAKKKFVGVGGTVVTGWTTKGRDVSLYATPIVTPISEILPLHELDQDESLPNAILGFDFFYGYVVQIDYRARMVRVFDPKDYAPPAGYQSLPVQFVDHIPTVEGTLTLPGIPKRPVVIELDTGSAFGIDISNRVVQRDALDLRFPGEATDTSSGIGTRLSRPIGPADATLGDLRFSAEARLLLTKRPTVANPLRLPSEYDITLGNAALSKFEIIFDYPHSRIFIKPSKQ